LAPDPVEEGGGGPEPKGRLAGQELIIADVGVWEEEVEEGVDLRVVGVGTE
jgi:hypothetical protein